MKLRDLSYLIALAKTEHFGKAAELAHVSQPTLSVQLKKLEDRLGVVLVERDNKHVRLTPAGKVIAEKAALVHREIEGIKEYAASQKDPLSGDIHLGIIPTLGPYLLPKVMGSFVEAFPKVSLWLHEAQTKSLLADLENGTLDLAILSPPLSNDNFTTLPLFTEPFYFTVHHQHPLAKRKTVTLKDINSEKILLLTDGHCFHEQAMNLCARAHLEPHDFRATSLETLRHMVAENLGSTLMPKLATEWTNPLIKHIPFKDNMLKRELVLAFRKTHTRTSLFEKIAKVFSKSYRFN